MKLATAILLFALSAFAQPVEIVLATYGSGQLHDVTSTVRSALASGKRDLPVTLDALATSDPAPGRVKMLRIVYRVNGSLYEVMANDFETITFPTGAPVTTAAATQPAPAPTTSVQPTTGGFFDTPGATTSPTPSAGTVGSSAASAGAPAVSAPSTSAAVPAPVTVSPVASVPNGACFYVQPNFSGSPYCFATGSATSTLGDQRRHFRSMRLVGSAKAAWLFDADNFTGASVRLTQSQPNLRTAQGSYYSTDFEDRAVSVRVE
ncbi:MAG: hypothetical protein ABI972_23430 [Acidobacteriota bacterium]